MSKKLILFTKEDCLKKATEWGLMRRYYFNTFIAPTLHRILETTNWRMAVTIAVYWATFILMVAVHIRKGL